MPSLPRQRGGRVAASERAWQGATAISVAVGVGFSLVLMSVSAGVAQTISRRLNGRGLDHVPGLDVSLIDRILTALTVVVTAAMLAQTGIVTFVLGVTTMRSRREEIAIRRQSGVLRSRLIVEFVRAVLRPAFIGGVLGEVGGTAAAVLLRGHTVLPVRFTAMSVLAAFPTTVLLAVAATLWPAWQAANISPALLRRE